MTKLYRTFALAGAVTLVATSVALACTTKSATVIGRMSAATAPAGSQCAASGATCSMFEVMSATNADGLALGDLNGKTLKATMAPGVVIPASTPAGAIWVAKADVNWETGMLQIASVEPASEPVATAAVASWEKSMALASSKGGCCMSGAKAATAGAGTCASKTDAATAGAGSCASKADAATAGAGSCASKTDAATAGSKGACGSKTDAATASNKADGCCASKASAATASSKGACGAKADGATANSSTCHDKSAKSDAAAAAARALTLNVNGMTCGGCASKVEKALTGVKGVASAKVDLEKKNVIVNAEEGVKAEDLVKAIKAAGFDAQLAAAEKTSEARG